MAFNQNDIYTSSGNVMLFNSWTPYVSKFDTSTFYNWEQDNVPLYDLEERTYELWEQGGFATSAGVPGLALTVSADATPEEFLVNSNIFTDLSSAIAAIPKVVRFPVLVEVGNYRDIGPLELHNFRIEEGGSIEIINRCFARTYNASSDVRTTGADGVYSMPTAISSLDLSNTFNDTSCVHIGANVFVSGGSDSRLTQVNSVFYPSHTLRSAPLTVTLEDGSFITSTSNQFAPNAFEGAGVDLTIAGSDISGFNTDTGGSLARTSVQASDRISGNVYGNTCTRISVKNCDGPIYIRNFFVDSAKLNPVGIEVNNSKVLIENCTSIRAQEAGFKFSNSEVTLSRSAFAYRNYKEATATTRESELGTGFHFINSDVLVSSLPLDVTSTSVGDTGAQGRDATVIASRNTRGFVLDNSKLRGGVKRSSSSNAETGGTVCSELNTSAGIVLNNSNIDLKGLIDVFGNDVGLETNSSFLKYENMTFDGNQTKGITSLNSAIRYASDAIQENSVRRQLEFSGNSVHLDLKAGSTFDFDVTDTVPSSYGNSFFRNAFAGTPAVFVDNNSTADLIKPYIDVTDVIGTGTVYGRAIKATNGSTATLNGAENGATFILGPSQYATQRTMAGACADKNSTINFHGPTAVAQFGVNVLAKDNSVMNFEPRRVEGSYVPDQSFGLSSPLNHTTVELHSTRSCLVAQRNSTVNMRDLGAFNANWGSTTSGAFILETTNYQLPLSGSVSGGSMQFFANPQDETAIGNGLNTIGSVTVPVIPTLAGRTNTLIINDDGYLSPDYTVRGDISQGGVCLRAVESSVVNTNNVHFPVPVNASPADGLYYDVSGDLCDRFNIWNIADDSRLNASYVSLSGMHPISCEQHGPSALYLGEDGPASGAPSGTPDTGALSILDAFGAGSAVWVVPSGVDVNSQFNRFYPVSGDGLNPETASALAGAGINVSGNEPRLFGVSGGYNNRGFFRLYWTPKSSARLLQNDVGGAVTFSGVVGPAYQTFAQGYNCSGDLSAIVPEGEVNAGAVAPDLLKLSFDSDGNGIPDKLWTSGFYYCGEMLEENPTQCILEESAADMFANARNASVNFAGTPRKTTIYSDTTDRIGESYPGDQIRGFKSASIFDLSRDN
ncbi:MAG: hypothetical protein CMJ25_27125 [Phycisphaerae bacterium]|nr:hypothetical protein [Phycisphaerae bacterium]